MCLTPLFFFTTKHHNAVLAVVTFKPFPCYNLRMVSLPRWWTLFGVLVYLMPLLAAIVVAITGIGGSLFSGDITLSKGVVLSLIYWSLAGITCGTSSLISSISGIRIRDVRISKTGPVVHIDVTFFNPTRRYVSVQKVTLNGKGHDIVFGPGEGILPPGQSWNRRFSRALAEPDKAQMFRLVTYLSDGKVVSHALHLPASARLE